MRKFLKHILIFGSIVLVIFSSLGYAVDSGLKESGIGNFPEWRDIEQRKINADLIITGSSRAWLHVSPAILDTALGVNSYNLGMDGQDFKIQNMRYKLYEKYNKRPVVIVQCMDINTLHKKEELYNAEQFAPYLDEPMVRQGIKEYTSFSWADHYNPFTKYQYRREYIAKGLLEFFNVKHFKSGKYKGYRGKDRGWDYSFERAKRDQPNGWTEKVDNELVDLFEAYLTCCKEEGIKIILVYPPEYIEGQQLVRNRDSIINMYREFSRKHGIVFLDYSSDVMSSKKKYFYNSQHLNRRAAEMFTARLANDIRPYL